MERRSSLTSWFHGDNAMNCSINISSKVPNIYKNAIRNACLTGKKKKRKGAYCFYLENIIMEELNIRFAQCGHWDCWVHSGVAWLPADAERKTKQNKKKLKECLHLPKGSKAKKFGHGLHGKVNFYSFSRCSVKAADGAALAPCRPHPSSSPPGLALPLLVFCWP